MDGLRQEGMAGRAVTALARAAAIAGAMVLVLLVALTVASIVGRSMIPFGLQPIAGDFELVELAMGPVVFAFLPWCHLTGGHASVDILTARFGAAAQRVILLVGDLLMLAAALLIAWRLWLGMLDKLAYAETTFIREIPVWWAYAAALPGACVFVLVAAWCAWRSFAGTERRLA